jgi:hypothetical protein
MMVGYHSISGWNKLAVQVSTCSHPLSSARPPKQSQRVESRQSRQVKGIKNKVGSCGLWPVYSSRMHKCVLSQSLLPDAHTVQTRSPPIPKRQKSNNVSRGPHAMSTRSPTRERNPKQTNSGEAPPVNRLLNRLQETIKRFANIC